MKLISFLLAILVLIALNGMTFLVLQFPWLIWVMIMFGLLVMVAALIDNFLEGGE